VTASKASPCKNLRWTNAGALAPGRQILGVRVSSGRGESNPRTRLGRPLHCHCATPASGCWELNPGHILPRDAYYRYTTPRFWCGTATITPLPGIGAGRTTVIVHPVVARLPSADALAPRREKFTRGFGSLSIGEKPRFRGGNSLLHGVRSSRKTRSTSLSPLFLKVQFAICNLKFIILKSIELHSPIFS